MEVSTSAQSPNTQKLEALLSQDSIFETRMDTKTRTVLQSAITSELSHQAKAMLECLACSPLGLPFCLLAEEFANAEDAFNDLVNASLIDLSLAASQRAVLVPFAREAVLLALTTDGRRDAIESRVTDLYAHWLHEVEDFKDDKEEAGLITETIVRYLRQRQLLKATGLFISFGWLCAFFGQAVRIQRVYEEIMKEDRGKDLGDAYEAGRLLFMYQIARVAKKRFDLEACDADYHQIHSLALEGRVVLDPRIEIHLAHTLMERMINENRYQEASDFLRGAFDRIALHKMTSETLAVFLHNKAYLLGRWSRSSSSVDEATRLTEECVTVLHEVVKTLHACLKKALPVQGRYYRMKLAKALQDLAYYLRMLDRLEEAERAIKECLSSWDELKITTSRLLAGPLSEYAQLLLTKGEFENANMMSLRAIELLNPTPQSGDRGMLLVEWAHIFELQGRLPEEKELLLTALPLIVPSRINFRVEAEQRLERIRVIEESSVRYQLDNHRYCQWYQRYLPLEQFDDTAWLAQAGPFTDEEKRKWDELYPERHDAAVWKQLEEIIGCSREREFEQSVALGRLPHIHYPAIDRENVLLHIRDFEALKEEITREENNVVMRRLYLSKIEEQLLILRSVEATYKHDIDALRECNETLFGRISKAEMEVALREFFKMLKQAERHPQARETAEQLLTQLKQWQLSAEDFLSIEEMAEEKHIPEKLRLWSDTPVSWQNVQKLYEDAINTYGFADWCIIPSPDQTVLSLNLGRCEMKLPTNKRYTVLIAVEYLAEEIETHMLRAACGKRSKVALLGSGTRGYLPADEGLAVLAIQEARAAHQLGRKENSWITTLAPGMALGVLTPPQSFRSLHEFLTKAFLVKRLRSSRYETYSAALEAARYDSLYRVSRTFWGIPGHDITGVCKLQDRVYLQGFREVSEKMKTVPIEHLLVGSIGINDLDDMRNLHILEPAIKRQYLSHDPELFERIIALEKES